MVNKRFNVAVLGAAGGIGQPLSLLLKNSLYVDNLHLFDVIPVVNGVAVDLSHINTPAKVKGFAGDLKDKAIQKQRLLEALEGIEIAVIPAGVPRKPGMTRDDLFNINAGIVAELIQGIADKCPECMICVISNPVNSTVPIAAEVLRAKGVYNPKRLFGVSTLDIVRADTFVAELLGMEPGQLNIEVIGGHSGETILPVLSPYESQLSHEKIEALTTRIQNAGTEVVEAKAGGGSATLSMAYAGARFVNSLMRAMDGEKNVTECAYVSNNLVPGCEFFASKVSLGPAGCEKIHPIPKLSDFEQSQLEKSVIPDLKKQIGKGISFVEQWQ